ncbi:MaoC family dehydratase N-terminal domain-containing protein [Mycolicibacterium sp.]|uniref:FAS1-like dehydratase domain-containing protein n=1 Tax=Mycolicibacterium sp. TaxID=2320850 RepID=UPI0037CAA6D7
MTALDELRARVGQKVPFRGADSVTQNDIRRKLEVFCSSCPLHDDETTAKANGYLGVVAPVTMTPLWGLPPYWAPGQPSPYLVEEFEGKEMTGNVTDTLALPFTRAVNAGSEWHYHTPLYVGDRLHGTTTVISVEQKRTRMGTGVFLEYESEYLKDSGDLVALNRNTVFNYNPENVATPRPEPGIRARAARDDRVRPPRQPLDDADSGIDWNAPLDFGDVTVGAEICGPILVLTYQRMVMNVAADRMFSGIHHSTAAARAAGLGDIIFNTRGLETLLETGLRRWMGLRGRLVRLGPFKMTVPVHPGAVVQARWTVTGKRAGATGGDVDLEFSIFAGDRKAVKGIAAVSVPMPETRPGER